MMYVRVGQLTGKDIPGYVFLKKIHFLYLCKLVVEKFQRRNCIYIGCHSHRHLTKKPKTSSYSQAIHVKTAS